MKPLTRNVRRRLFWVLVGVFIVGTPILIGYSKGYRLDDALLLIETGGIYIHSDLENTRVYLNGKYIDRTGIFLKNKYIQELTPNRWYEVWMEKDGYQSWVKELKVYPNIVTEAQVLMLPEVFTWTDIASTTEITVIPTTTTLPESVATSGTSTVALVANPEFEDLAMYFATTKDQFAVEVATSTFIFENGKRVSTTTTVIEYQFPSDIITVASTSELASYLTVRERDGMLTWLDGGDLYATWVRTTEQTPYYFCNATCTPTIVIDWEEPITYYDFYPSRNDVVILGTGRGIYAVELDNRSQRNIQPYIEQAGLTFRLLPDGTLVVFDGVQFSKTSW